MIPKGDRRAEWVAGEPRGASVGILTSDEEVLAGVLVVVGVPSCPV